jgi:hypothetical protein
MELGGAEVGGVMYAIGGSGLDTMEYFDSGTWKIASEKAWKIAREKLLIAEDLACTARGTEIFVVHEFGTTEIFDSATAGWTLGPNLPEKLGDTGEVLNVGETIYALCALNERDQPLYRLDEVAGKWDLVAEISELYNITHFTAQGLDEDHIFVTGGALYPFHGERSEAMWIIDVSDGHIHETWDGIAALPNDDWEVTAEDNVHFPLIDNIFEIRFRPCASTGETHRPVWFITRHSAPNTSMVD